MRPEDLYVPNDLDALRMENELLAFENQYLKVRAAEQKAAGASDASRSPAETVPPGSRVVDADLYEQLRKARSDLVWLIRRMESTPARLVLRRWEGWRALAHRYLDRDDDR